jgi:flagellar basal body rod protein FlgF
MDRLIFTSLSATTTGSMSRVQLTNDLANVSTTGFKRGFDIRPAAGKLAGPGFETRYQPVITDVNNFINLEAGTPYQTDNPLDVSMNDKTVLGVQANDGSLAFTRRGDLRLSAEGFLETANGYLVATEGGGPLTVPVGGMISITPDGTVFFQADGGSLTARAGLGLFSASVDYGPSHGAKLQIRNGLHGLTLCSEQPAQNWSGQGAILKPAICRDQQLLGKSLDG